MIRPTALVCIALLMTSGCDDDPSGPADAGSPVDRGPVADADPDATPPPVDAAPDARDRDLAGPLDAAPDGEMPDIDATPDAGAVSDATLDADPVPDAAPDAGPPWIGDGVCDPTAVIELAAIDRRAGSTADAPAGAEPSCSMGGGSPERVFTWVAPADGVACLSVADADFDTVLYVRREPCNAPESEVACNDDAGDLGLGVQSALGLQVEAGARYFAFVDGYAGGEAAASGAFTLEIGQGPCRHGGRLRCAEDGDCPAGRVCDGGGCVECAADGDCREGFRCADNRCEERPMLGEGACRLERIVVLDGFSAYAGDNAGAPVDDLGSCNPGTIGPEVAHRFMPSVDGPVCARTLGSALDTVVYVRSVCADPGTEAVCHDDVSDDELTSAADFDAVAGVPVFIFVDTYTLQDVGDYVLAVVPGPCADAPVCSDDQPCPDGQDCRINACFAP